MKTLYINYNHDITHDKANVLIAIVNNLINQGYESVYFMINSGGGEVNAGIALYNYFKSLPIEVVMHNMGSIDSIATVVFLAGDKRYACPNTTFLFHGVKIPIQAYATLAQLNEVVDSMTKDQEKISGIICENTKIKKQTLNKLFSQGETQNLTFAVQNRLIEKVSFPEIPKDAEIVTIDFDKQST